MLTQDDVWGFQFSKFKLMLVLVLMDQTWLWLQLLDFVQPVLLNGLYPQIAVGNKSLINKSCSDSATLY